MPTIIIAKTHRIGNPGQPWKERARRKERAIKRELNRISRRGKH